MACRHQSKEHLEKAANLVAETGYHRRDPELAELRAALTAEPAASAVGLAGKSRITPQLTLRARAI